MLLLGIDIGTSSIKVAIVDAQSQKCISTVQYPESETGIISLQKGWAEQDPEMWWENVQQAILKAHAEKKYDPKQIIAVGIAYQMHGLVCVDKNQQILRNSIIWCDSRAVDIGNKAFDTIGHERSLQHLLNSPGNFTAAKLAWVKENEPGTYALIDKVMLPGDFIAMKLTGQVTTSISALSEGIFWDFKEHGLSKDIFEYFGFDTSLIPDLKDVFTEHGTITSAIAQQLSLPEGIPVTYKAGDQPNNALSLNVLDPGEVAATAGTSGVIYGVSDQLVYDQQSRINSFAHVNFIEEQKRIGVLLCINGTGILNSWIKNISGNKFSYAQMNEAAAAIEPGSNGLQMLPFGNGAERMLENKIVQSHVHNIDFNVHSPAHLFRAAQEGIAFAFRYGLDIMRENGMLPSVIRAGKANMFLSDVFTNSFVNATNVPVELHESDGSVGAAKGAGIGAGYYKTAKEAFTDSTPLHLVEPTQGVLYDELYSEWKQLLERQLA
ncbi:MAG: FGGY family carbohydrate kinase [Ferruginibacter sp.]